MPAAARAAARAASRTPTSPASAWAFGLGIAAAGLWVLTLRSNTIPRRNPLEEVLSVVLLALIAAGATLAISLGWAALRQMQRDQRLHGKTLAIIGLMLGVLAVPPALLRLFSGSRIDGYQIAIPALTAFTAALGYMAYRTYRWQASIDPLTQDNSQVGDPPHGSKGLRTRFLMSMGAVVTVTAVLLVSIAVGEAMRTRTTGQAQLVEESSPEKIAADQALIAKYGQCLTALGYNMSPDELAYRTVRVFGDIMQVTILNQDGSFLHVHFEVEGGRIDDHYEFWDKGSGRVSFEPVPSESEQHAVGPPC